MKKVFALLAALCIALFLSVPVFADVLPPQFFTVTVGENPIDRYRMEQADDGTHYFVRDGVINAGTAIRVLNTVILDGEEYGEFRASYDVGKWQPYYFRMSDVRSVPETTTVMQTQEEPSVVVTPTQVDPTVTVTPTLTVPTTVTQTQPETTAAQIAETQPETSAQETETIGAITMTQEETTAQETTAAARTETTGRSTKQIVYACCIAAIVLALTAAVTLTLIRRKSTRK